MKNSGDTASCLRVVNDIFVGDEDLEQLVAHARKKMQKKVLDEKEAEMEKTPPRRSEKGKKGPKTTAKIHPMFKAKEQRPVEPLSPIPSCPDSPGSVSALDGASGDDGSRGWPGPPCAVQRTCTFSTARRGW